MDRSSNQTASKNGAQERNIEALKAKGPSASTADTIVQTVQQGLYHRTIAQNLALLRDAMEIYVVTKEWQKASAVSLQLATHYSGLELHDQIAAAPYRKQADEYYVRCAGKRAASRNCRSLSVMPTCKRRPLQPHRGAGKQHQ